jgi:predicted enzyme related to lactoylglutathione lyase
MKSAGYLKHIIIDAEDAELVARFWSSVLGLPIERSFGPFTKLESPSVGPALTIQKVPARTHDKSNIHFDLQTNDLDTSETYVLSLGGKLVDVKHKGQWEWRIMADPEGNLFCLVIQ